jgi:glucose dehydrogenase
MGQNYSAQTIITNQNAKSLSVNWIFPVPAAPGAVASLQGAATEGAGPTPIVVNGVVYVVTNYNVAYALDAGDGHVLWSTQLPVSLNATTKKIWFIGSLNHLHNGMVFFTNNVLGGPLLWVGTNQYQIMALDAITGKLVVNFPSFVPGENVPGGFGAIPKANSPGIAIDEKKGILMTDANGGLPGAMRGYFKGWDVSKPWTGMASGTRPPVLWQTFVMPPQDASDPNWSLNSVRNMTYAWSFNSTAQIDLKALPASQLQSMLYKDWGDMGYNGTVAMDVTGGSWGGSWVVDSNKGMLFAASDDVAPYYSVNPHRPGPNLWGASIFGINETTGKIIWAFQQASHDSWDRDCSWGVTYAPQMTIGGQTKDVLLKGCKSGYVFGLDANTGKMLWYYFPSNVPIYQYDRLYDIRNSTQMNLPWPNYPSNSSILWHCGVTGCLEADIAYDPSTNTVFEPSFYSPIDVVPDPCAYKMPCVSDSGIKSTPHGVTNTTIYAIDAATGKQKWGYLIPNQAYRGGLTVSGGVVYVTTADGILRLLDANTGALILALPEGGPLRVQPAIGADINGVMKVFLVDGAPGAIVALALQPGQTPSTSVSTVVQTQTQTVTQSGTVVTQTSVTTATVSGPGSVSTGVTTVTNTVTSSVGGTGGIDPTAFYGVAGVAAVLAIATAALAVRGRRRPA